MPWRTTKSLGSGAGARSGNGDDCGGKGPEWPVECHEVWHYDDKTHIQKLRRVIALCPACHEVKHIGFAGSRGRHNEALKHLADVNSWSLSDAEVYVALAFRVWEERCKHEWQLDCKWLGRNFGIKIPPKSGKSGPRP